MDYFELIQLPVDQLKKSLLQHYLENKSFFTLLTHEIAPLAQGNSQILLDSQDRIIISPIMKNLIGLLGESHPEMIEETFDRVTHYAPEGVVKEEKINTRLDDSLFKENLLYDIRNHLSPESPYIELLEQAYFNNSFEWTRLRIIRCLGKIGGEAATGAIIRVCRAETDRAGRQLQEALRWVPPGTPLNPDLPPHIKGVVDNFVKFEEIVVPESISLELFGSTRDSQPSLEELEGHFPDHFDTLLGLLKKGLTQGDNLKAWDYLQKLKKYHPDHPRTWSELGNYYWRLEGSLEKAIGCFRRSLTLDSEGFSNYYALGVLYKNSQQFGKSLWAADQFLTFFPDDPEAIGLKGQAYLGLENYDFAISFFLKSLSIDPESLMIPLFLIESLIKEGDKNTLSSLPDLIPPSFKHPHICECWADSVKRDTPERALIFYKKSLEKIQNQIGGLKNPPDPTTLDNLNRLIKKISSLEENI